MDQAPEATEKKKILSPLQWWLSASAMFALAIVPITVGLFYMLNLTKRLFDQPLQYNPLLGLIIGLLLSLLAGYFYSGIARKHAE
jgi:amino acid transporter